MAAQASTDQVYRVLATALDGAFYRTLYGDVAAAGTDPVRHYVDEGWREGRDPAPWFSTKAYLARNPDLGDANPFHHYLTSGWREGREAEASALAGAWLWRAADAGGAPDWTYAADGEVSRPGDRRRVAASPGETRARLAAAFDAAFYLAANPDIAQAGADPLEHFLTTGWREGRDPARGFSVADYLELNPDVAAAGINPFEHYVVAGRAEGRPARHALGFRHQVISRLVPLAERQALAARRSATVGVGGLVALETGLQARRNPDGRLHLTVSHDNFAANVGGVQIGLQREAEGIAAQATDHLHLYPVAPWPTVRPPAIVAPVGVWWNGRDLGAFAAADIAEVLRRRNAETPEARVSFAVHSLLGHAVEETIQILDAAGARAGYFWVHDFTSLCAGVHLMRDDVADCGAPPPGSAACGVCVYGPGRAAHIQAHATLFEALDLTVVAPSQSAYDTWRGGAGARPDRPHLIHPHARLVPRPAPAKAHAGGPLKVAFLGMASAHKGWPAFAALAERHVDDPRYAFLHLGATAAPGAPVAFHKVAANAANPLAMRQALEALEVDVAILWSLCRETFSFTAYEAIAVGAAVLTGPDSGNVAALVADGRHGRLLADEAELAALFETGAVLELAPARRETYDLAFSALTADLVEAA